MKKKIRIVLGKKYKFVDIFDCSVHEGIPSRKTVTIHTDIETGKPKSYRSVYYFVKYYGQISESCFLKRSYK